MYSYSIKFPFSIRRSNISDISFRVNITGLKFSSKYKTLQASNNLTNIIILYYNMYY